MEEDNSNQQKTSKYNSAVAQLQRIDRLIDKIHLRAADSNYKEWNELLDRVWTELSADLISSSPRVKEFDDINNNLSKIGELNFKNNGFNKTTDYDLKKKLIVSKNLLMKKEIFLRRLQNELGKGTKWEEGDEDYMDS